MSRRGNTGTIFWGLILIAAGSVFLARNLGYAVPVWSGVARYWPTLLIVWGFLKLVDYARWSRSGRPGSLFSGGEVALLVVVILGGTALTAASNMSPDFATLFEITDIDLWDITGNTYEYTEHIEREVGAGASIDVINRYGAIEIAAADTDRIVVDVRKTVIAPDPAAADDLSKLLTFSISEQGSRFRVLSSFNRDENRVRGRRFRTSLNIQVPKSASVSVDNRNGAVTIAGLVGDQKIVNGYGRVSVRGVTGSVDVTNRNESVLIEDIEGAVTLSNEYSDSMVRNVAGNLEIRHKNGSLEVSGSRGDVTLTNAYGPVAVSSVRGPLTINGKNSSVEVDGAEEGVTVRTEYENVRIRQVSGPVIIQNRNGSVGLSFSQPPVKDVRIQSEYGDVTVELPSASSFIADARTRYGEATSDFSELVQKSESERVSMSGQVGSAGPEIRIDNRNGSIHFERR